MIYVLDANTIIALLEDEPGGEVVGQILDDSLNTCFIHAVNLCEVYYQFRRKAGESVGLNIVHEILKMPITLREDMDLSFWQQAGKIKADYRRISLADCFCIALAQRLSGIVVTSDHHEMDVIDKNETAKVKFIR